MCVCWARVRELHIILLPVCPFHLFAFYFRWARFFLVCLLSLPNTLPEFTFLRAPQFYEDVYTIRFFFSDDHIPIMSVIIFIYSFISIHFKWFANDFDVDILRAAVVISHNILREKKSKREFVHNCRFVGWSAGRRHINEYRWNVEKRGLPTICYWLWKIGFYYINFSKWSTWKTIPNNPSLPCCYTLIRIYCFHFACFITNISADRVFSLAPHSECVQEKQRKEIVIVARSGLAIWWTGII